jgi:hypothetical protein
MFIVGGQELDFRLQPISELPGLYYEPIGEARLSGNIWKILSYVHLERAEENLVTVRNYAKFNIEFCQRHEHSDWVNLT